MEFHKARSKATCSKEFVVEMLVGGLKPELKEIGIDSKITIVLQAALTAKAFEAHDESFLKRAQKMQNNTPEKISLQ